MRRDGLYAYTCIQKRVCVCARSQVYLSVEEDQSSEVGGVFKEVQTNQDLAVEASDILCAMQAAAEEIK